MLQSIKALFLVSALNSLYLLCVDSLANSESEIATTKIDSNVDCVDLSDGTSYCEYKNSLCFDGESLLFIVINNNRSGDINTNPENDGWLYLDRGGFSDNGLPYGSGLTGQFQPESYLVNNKVRFMEGLIALVPFHFDPSNIYHFAASVLTGYHARRHHLNKSSSSLPNNNKQMTSQNCPGFDEAFLFMKAEEMSDWTTNLAQLALSRCSLLAFEDDFIFQSMSSPKPLCFRRAVIFGTSINLFSGIWDAVEFRNLVASQHKILFEKKIITICIRTKSRLILNIQEFASAIQTWAPTLSIVIANFEIMNFKEQLDLMSKTVIFIAVHGAGLTNVIFLPGGSSVIELSPYKFNHVMYEKISINAGHMYHRYTASFAEMRYGNDSVMVQFSRVLSTARISNRQCNKIEPTCMRMARDGDIMIDLQRFKSYFDAATDVIEDIESLFRVDEFAKLRQEALYTVL